MLEQLGLGIILSFEDNFTPQANNAINSMFNLETKAEQMASNVQKSLNNLQNLMLSGFSLSQIGSEFQSAGKAITGVFKNAFSEIANASAKMETYKAQFKTVFGDQAQKKMDWAVNFAVKTPFELKDLVSSMQKMGSQKIDVSKMFKNSKGQNKAFMEYMGDLATRNMDANGGVSGMGIAISNAWSGQLRSLEQRFDLAKQDLQGLKKYAGKDQAKFMEEFVKLADKYAPNAMKNLEGTWEQTMSNMEDAWFNMKFRLGDKGNGADVFGSMKKSLNKVAGLLFEISTNGKMLGTLRNLFQDLWKPVDKLVDLLTSAVRGIFKFAEAHPVLSSIIAKFVAFSGIALMLVGTIMKLSGGVMIFATSLVSAYANLKILKSLNLGGDLAKIASGFGLVGSAMKSVIFIAGAVGLAYKFNLGGMRKSVDDTIAVFVKANEYRKQLMNANVTNRDQLFGQRFKSTANGLGYMMAKFEALKIVAKDSYEVVMKGHSDVLRVFTQNHFDPVSRFGLVKFQRYLIPLMTAIKEFFTQFKVGLGDAVKTTEQALNFILTPIIAVKKAFSTMLGGEGTVEAQKNLKALKDILGHVGRIAGSVLGTLVGFKVVKSVTSFMLSPFKALLGILGKVQTKASNVFKKLNPANWFSKKSMDSYLSTMKIRGQVGRFTGRNNSEEDFKAMGLGLSRSQQRAGFLYQKALLQDATGKRFTNKQLSAMGIVKPDSTAVAMMKGMTRGLVSGISTAFTKGVGAIKGRSELVETRLSNDPYSKFKPVRLDTQNRALDNSIDNTLMAGKKGYNGANSLQVVRRNPILDTLFGQKFYSVNSDGTRNAMGSYGGALTKFKDNTQMRLASQLVEPPMKQRSDFTNERDYRAYQKSVVKPDRKLGVMANSLKGFNESTSVYKRVEKNLGNYIGHGKAGAGQFRMTPNMSPIQKTLIRARKKQAIMGVLNNDEETLSRFQNRNTAKIGTVSQQFAQERETTGGGDVFAKKQGFLSKALFGQKLYTVGQRANGQLYENQVARVGGLFNNARNDGRYNPQGDTSLKTRVTTGASALGGALKEDGASLKNYAMPKIQAFKGIVQSKLGELGNQLMFMGSAFKDMVKVSPIAQKIRGAVGKFTQNLSYFGNRIVAKFQNNGLVQKLSGAFMTLKGGLTRAFSTISQSVLRLKDSAITMMGNIKNTVSSQIARFKATKFGGGLMNVGSAIKNSKTGQLVAGWGSTAKGKVMTAGRNLVGNIPIIGSRLPSIRGNLPSTGIIGAVGRGAGAVGRGAMTVGSGAIRGVGAIGRGAVRGVGAIGRGAMNLGMGAMGLMGGAMRMIPGLALGGMIASSVVGGIKGTGANLSDKDRNALAKKRGLKKDDNLGLGMAKISQDLSKFDFKKFWQGFKKSAKTMIPIFKDIFKDMVRIGKQAFPVLMKEVGRLGKNIAQQLPSILAKLPSAIKGIVKQAIPILKTIWTKFTEGLGQFIATGLPKLLDGFSKFVGWVAKEGIPLICDGLSELATFFGTTVVPKLLELAQKFVAWFFDEGVPKILQALGQLLQSIVSHLPEILTAIGGLLLNILSAVGELGLTIIGKIPGFVANIASFIWDGITGCFSKIGGWLKDFFSGLLSNVIDSILPDGMASAVKGFLGIKHHGGLYMSPDEHMAIIQEGETVLPRGKSERLDAMLEGRSYWQQRDRDKAMRTQPFKLAKVSGGQGSGTSVQDHSTSINIDKVEIVVKADKLSSADARKQAQMILNEFRKLNKEEKLRSSTKRKDPVMA